MAGRNVPEGEIEARLFAAGRTLADYGVLESGLPLVKGEGGGWRALHVEDEAVRRACSRYLRQRGVKVVPRAEVRP